MSEASKRKTAVLVGAGMVAGTHVSAIAGIGAKLRLKGIVSRSGTNAQKLAMQATSELNEEVMVFDSIHDVAADPDIDFAIVVTPPNARVDLIEPLAAAGKHILLEKPIGRNLGEAKAIVEVCETTNVHLGIVFQHRVRASSRKAMALVQTGELGELGIADIRVPWWREQSYYDEPGRGSYARDGGGVMISQAIHTLDLALRLTGPVKSVLAMAKTSTFHRMESEDFVVAGLEFANGAVGSMMASSASFPGAAESITLHFEKASMHLEAGQLIVSWRDGQVETFGDVAGTGGGADPMAFTHEWHQEVIEDFVDALNGASVKMISGREALAVHALIEASTLSAQSGSKQYLES